MRFSIVIPVYNVAPYLRECLDSVTAQTYTDWEAICVDDGSTDGSSAILDQYAEVDSRFRVIHQCNRGVSSARNRALKEAVGEWIVFVDSDDYIDRSLLSRVVDKMTQDKSVDIVGYGFVLLSEDGEKSSYVFDDPFGASFWQCAYHRDVVGHVRFPSLTIGEDRVFVVRCLRRAKRIATISGTSYAYRLRPGSAIRGKWSFRKRWDNFRHAIILLWLMFVTPQANRRWVLRYIRRVFDTGVALFTGEVK